MELNYAALSDVGNVRNNNEDYLFAGKINTDEYLFIVADGMGGHKAGEVASRKAVSVFVQQVEKGLSSNFPEDLKRIVLLVNETLLAEGRQFQEKSGMGTTLSVLYIKENTGYIAHVGDSRIYLLTLANQGSLEKTQNDEVKNTPENKENSGSYRTLNHTFKQLTEDHSFVGKLLKDGYITEEEARNHPRRNVLFQSIGLKSDITVQLTEGIPIEPGQRFLLCSDGLYGVVADSLLAEYLLSGRPSAVCRSLIRKAKENGGPDNITAIIVSTDKPDDTESDTLPDTVFDDTAPIIIPQSQTVPEIITDEINNANANAGAKTSRKKTRFVLLALLVILFAVIIFLVIKWNTDDKHKKRKSIPASHVIETKVSPAPSTPVPSGNPVSTGLGISNGKEKPLTGAPALPIDRPLTSKENKTPGKK